MKSHSHDRCHMDSPVKDKLRLIVNQDLTKKVEAKEAKARKKLSDMEKYEMALKEQVKHGK